MRAKSRLKRVGSRRVAVVAVGAVVAIVVLAGVAFAAITQPTGSPFVVPDDGSGNPVAFTVIATGYTPGSLVSLEQCDGVDHTVAGWSPTADCDLGSSQAPVLADGTGTATFSSTDPNHAFTPFKGESPQSLFNCLSPNDPALSPSNGLTDFRNCQIRVSTSNVNVTGDQSFLSIQLPDAVAPTTTTSVGGLTTSTTSASAIVSPQATSNLPFTGASSVPMALGALVLVATGAALAIGSRKRTA